MRSRMSLGVGLLLVGGLLLVASSGAFDALSADRGVEIETIEDERALLTLENQEQVDLVDGDFVCEGFFCYRGYREYDVEIVTIRDRTAPPALPIDEDTVSLETTGSDNPSLEQWNLTAAGDDHVVVGKFRCNAPFGEQQSGSTTLTFDIETGDGEITISLDREIAIRCMENP